MPASMIYQFRIRRGIFNNGAKNQNPMRLLILETNIQVFLTQRQDVILFNIKGIPPACAII